MKAWSYPNVSLICGQCHFIMDASVSKNEFPVEFRVKCPNSRCENYGKVFSVSPQYAFELHEITDRVAMEELST